MPVLYCFPPPRPQPPAPRLSQRIFAAMAGVSGLVLFTLGCQSTPAPVFVPAAKPPHATPRRSTRQQGKGEDGQGKSEIRLLKVV